MQKVIYLREKAGGRSSNCTNTKNEQSKIKKHQRFLHFIQKLYKNRIKPGSKTTAY